VIAEGLNPGPPPVTINSIMIDIQHDSPVPIHEQITSQLMAHIAAGTLKAGTRLADHRAYAQQLLANPQVVARAYADLEWEGVLRPFPAGGMEVIPGADVICQRRLQDQARQRVRQAIRQAQDCGIADAEIRQVLEQTLAAPPVAPLSPAELSAAIKKAPHVVAPGEVKTTHASSHRTSQDIQDLSRQKGRGSP
jgi:GntR family transcriptional regulator